MSFGSDVLRREAQGGEAPLSLDGFYKNNSHPDSGGCHVGFAYGVFIENGNVKGFRGNIPCNKWTCPHCAPAKVRKLKKRLFSGGLMEFVERKGFRNSKYAFKMLTLTCPGREFREAFTPEEALEQMSHAWEKLRKAMAKKWGVFHYLKLTEAQQDGYPHFHILIVGHAIAEKEVLAHIRDLWCGKYEMGNIDLQVLKKGLRGGVKYVMKYLTKCMEPIAPKKRIFTASRGALLSIKKPFREYIEKGFFLGQLDEETGFRSFELGSVSDLPEEGREKIVRAFCDLVMTGGMMEVAS